MDPIVPMLKAGDTGPLVVNLQDALLTLLEREIIRPLIAPDRPTMEELQKLSAAVKGEREQLLFGQFTQELIRYFQVQQGLSDNLRGVVEDTTAARLNEWLKKIGALDASPSFSVSGVVIHSDETPAAGLLIRAVDRDLRTEQALGEEAQTDANGVYRIVYPFDESVAAEQGTADIMVRAFDPDGTKLAESDVRFNAGPNEVINLMVPLTQQTEWSFLLSAVEPLLAGQGTDNATLPPWELNDTDIDFIVDETGLNLDRLRLWVLAANVMNVLSETVSSHLPASSLPSILLPSPQSAGATTLLFMELLYGWFRDGQPQRLEDLLHKSNDDLMDSLNRASAQNYIQALDSTVLAALPGMLNILRGGLALKTSVDPEVATLGDTLRLMPDADKLQLDKLDGPGVKLVTLLANAAPNDPPSWDERLKAVGDEGLLRAAQRSISLQSLTGGFVPWMRELQQSATSADPTLADLVAKDTVDWIAFARKNGVPREVVGDNDDARFTSFGRQIAARIQLMHPTLYVQQRIVSDRISVATDVKEPIAKFLAANSAFRLKQTPLLVYQGSADFSSGGLSKESLASVSTELMRIERVATLTPLLDYVGPLLSANYDSARSIVNRKSRVAFVAEMRDTIGDEDHAGQIYDAAAGVAANTDALVLRHSPLFRGRDLPVMPSENKLTGAAAPAAKAARVAAVVLPPNLQQLFGNQDYCQCAHGASLYGAAAYLADLLKMLGSAPPSNGLTPLQVLLGRRPDLAEVDLTGDNTDITLQYIDLVLEILEQPDWEAGIGFRVLRGGTPQNSNNDFDASLDQGIVPAALAADLATRRGIVLSEQRTADSAADVQNSGGVTLKSWVIRDLQSGLKLRLIGAVYGAYRVMVWPQSNAGASKEYRPWPTLLSAVAAKTSSARFPWTLPFDVNRDEANAWLLWLGATREDLLLALTSTSPWTNVDAACERLNLNPATRAVLTTAPDTAHEYKDWGFESASVGAKGVVDPIAGMVGTLIAGSIIWTGPESRPVDPPDWYALLKNVSLLRARARLTHRELLNVLEMRFVRAGAARFDISGPECDSAMMRLEAMNAALARRIHLFVRLWRLLGWSLADVDAAINARPGYTSSVDSAVALSPDCLLFIGNVARLSARTRVPAAICMDLFSGGKLDTTCYWNHDGATPARTRSRYETWFDNVALGRTRLAEFHLNDTRDALTSIVAPAIGLPKARISDHSTYVAAALGMPESELRALLPVGIVWFAPTQVFATANSSPIRVGDGADVKIEVLIGALSSGAGFSITFQDSDDGAAFQNIDATHLSVANPWPITGVTPLLSRFTYSGGKPYLSLSIIPTAGTNPALWITVRALLTAGEVDDELTLVNLTTLCKYGAFRRLLGKPIADVLTLIELSDLDPFAATATPDVALALLDARDAVGALELSVDATDQLLRGPDVSTSGNLEKRAGALLATARSANLAILNESTVTLDQRSVLLSKIRTDFGWDSGRIAEVLSTTHLGVDWGDYFAPLDVLPAGTNLPASITYDQKLQGLTALVSVRPVALRADIAPLLTGATGNLRVALTGLDTEAQSREAELTLLQKLLREKTPHTFQTNWSIAANVPLVIPTEWKGRFYYERALRRLCFVGWMSPADQAALVALGSSLNVSTSTPTLTAAINDLFTQSSQYTPRTDNTLVVRQGTAGFAAETLLLDTPGLQDRCGSILNQLLPEWRRDRLRAKLGDALAQSTGGTPDSADQLLSLLITVASSAVPPSSEKSAFDWFATDTRLLVSDPVTETSRAAFPETFDAVAQLLILAQFATKLALYPSQIPWLRGIWSGLDLKQLPTMRITSVRPDLWASLLALSKLVTLRKNRNIGAARLASVILASQVAAIDYARLADILDCTEANLRYLAAASGLNISTPAWLRDPVQLAQLVKCLELCSELQLPATLLLSAARAQSASRLILEAQSETQALRQVALGGTSDGNWPDEEKKVLDQIRQRRRDASVEYLIQARQVRDANDLCGYYLIDPQMGPCMLTSRIVQAISSVQLFIQRCFMALEPDVPPVAIDKGYWAWMKNYRVWEANRKVLLYPENWIAPELRHDKTPFFDDLISALQQSDVSSDKAELAVQSFLEKLTDFSKMEMVATCSTYDDDNRLQTTHVIARTLSQPHSYFYRQFRNLNSLDSTNSLGVWTSWQALGLDIEGNLPFLVVWQGRLFLFWAIFSKQSDEPSGEDLAKAKDTPVPSSKFWALKLAWSEYKSGVWTSRRLSQPDLSIIRVAAMRPTPDMEKNPAAAAVETVDEFFFKTSVQEEGVTIAGLFFWLSFDQQGYGRWLNKPFMTVFFDGHNVIKADGHYRLGTDYAYSLIQTSKEHAEVPVDGALPAKLQNRSDMKRPHLSPYPIDLIEASGSVRMFSRTPRNLSLLYAADIPIDVFSAPGVFSTLSIAPSSVAVPFVAADRVHQLFVYPTRELGISFISGPTFGASGAMLIFLISEVPKLHFYALDWVQASRLRRTLVTSGTEALLSFQSQDRVRNPPVPYLGEYAVPSDLISGAPDGDLEYSLYSTTATYNFELFFHVPFAVACALSKNQRFEEAQQHLRSHRYIR